MSGTDGSLLFNIAGDWAMAHVPNVVVFGGAVDPTDPTRLWAPRWWDTTGAAPTMTKGQVVRIDPLFAPTSSNTADADGTTVAPVYQALNRPAFAEAARPTEHRSPRFPGPGGRRKPNL